MRNINKVILIGNIARAPEVRVTNGGQKMATFVLATNRTWYDPMRNKQSQAEFHNMLAWGKIAEICERFLQKSTLVYIEGYLKARSWDGDDGHRCYRTEIVVQDILVLDRGIRHEKGTMGQENNDNHDYGNDDYQFDNNGGGSYDFSEYDDTGNSEGEKAPSALEKSFQEKLSEGNETQADTRRQTATAGSSTSLDEPLFEEETR